jgi:hypothetical protein
VRAARTDDVSCRILITLRDYAAMRLGVAVAHAAFETAVRDADCAVARATDPRAWVPVQVLENVARTFDDTIGPNFVLDAVTWVVPQRRDLSAMSLSTLITPEAFYARLDLPRKYYANHVRFEMERKRRGRFHVVLRYREDVPRTATSCQVARGVLHAVPLLFDLPLAQVEEHGCWSRGADACTYDVRFRSQIPLGVVAATGGALAAAAGALAIPTLGWLAVPIAAWAIGRELQLARTRRYMTLVTEEQRRALEEHEEAFQRRFDEIKALNAALERKLEEHGLKGHPK